MKVYMVSYEVYPFAKVGGLADVVGALPKMLKKQGIDVSIIMPLHKIVSKNSEKFGFNIEPLYEKIPVPVLRTDQTFSVYKSEIPGSEVPVFLISNDYYFSADDVYNGPDLAEQSIFFSNASLELIKKLGSKPDIVHSHDWQSSLVPVYIKSVYRSEPSFNNTSTVLTVHNLGYQGVFDPKYLEFAGLPQYLFNVDGLEFYGQINFLKGAILFADIINTVSPTYANEIMTEEYGEKLDGVLRIRSDDLFGILNGIDYSEYNPATDKRIYANYDVSHIDKKKINKVRLQEDLGLPKNEDVALMGMITRLVDQKGLDLLSRIMDYVALFNMQFVVLGTGDARYENYFRSLEQRYPDKVKANITFDVELAQKIYAGSDMFVMPSRYEPCGLGQMYSLRYGTVPVVRYTGGLADTVKEYDPHSLEGNGFGFRKYDAPYLLTSIAKALYFFNQEKKHWQRIIRNAMNTDLSWERSASEYVKLYEKALAKRRG